MFDFLLPPLGALLVYRAVQAQRRRAAALVRHQAIVSALPTEILRMIFSMLSNQDLSKVVLVNKRWKEVGEVLWTWEMLHLGRGDVDMLGIARVGHVEDITILDDDWEKDELEKVFQAVLDLPKLLDISVTGINLTSVESELLVNLVTSIEYVNISCSEFTDIQLNYLFEAIDETVKLKNLTISGVNLSKVDQDALALGVNQLETIYMPQTQLTADQVTCFLEQAGRQTKLWNVVMDSNTIEEDPILKKAPAQRVDQQIVDKARKNIRHLGLKYDFDNNPNWTGYSTGSSRIVAYVASQ